MNALLMAIFIILICLPMLIIRHFIDSTNISELIVVPMIIFPFLTVCIVATKSKDPDWKGLQNYGGSIYYGAWAVELSIAIGILALCNADLRTIIALAKASAILYGLALFGRILAWCGLASKIFSIMYKYMKNS